MENPLKFFREKAGLSQAELAVKASVSKRTVQNIEGKDREPNIKTLKALADALEVPVTVLL
jgi:transcriptional regulator with XRE-family HTH domain